MFYRSLTMNKFVYCVIKRQVSRTKISLRTSGGLSGPPKPPTGPREAAVYRLETAKCLELGPCYATAETTPVRSVPDDLRPRPLPPLYRSLRATEHQIADSQSAAVCT